MTRLTVVLGILVALFTLIAPAQPYAQGAQRISAIVNEDIISVRDVEARLHLVIVSSALRDGPELRQRLRPQVLRSLIDERLQLQEARRVKISVTDGELRGAFETIEKKNGLPPGGINIMFERSGIDRETLTEQIRATIAWSKLVRLRGGALIQISDDEINEEIAEFEANRDKPQYRVSEIFLPVDTTEQEEEVRRLADRMVQQIRSGADFSAIARQFSQSGSAAVGGEIGWVQSNQMDPELERAVASMTAGQVSDPIRTLSGFYIVALAEIKIPSQSTAEVVLALRQVLLPVPPGGDGASQVAAAEKATAQAKSCTDMDEAAKAVKSPAGADLGRVKLGEMAAPLRDQVERLPINQPTPPIKFANAVLVLMVCDRMTPKLAALERDEVREQLTRVRLDQQARRMLRDLRRAAFVDLRG